MLRIIHPDYLSTPSRWEFSVGLELLCRMTWGGGLAKPESKSHAGTSESRLRDAENGK